MKVYFWSSSRRSLGRGWFCTFEAISSFIRWFPCLEPKNNDWRFQIVRVSRRYVEVGRGCLFYRISKLRTTMAKWRHKGVFKTVNFQVDYVIEYNAFFGEEATFVYPASRILWEFLFILWTKGGASIFLCLGFCISRIFFWCIHCASPNTKTFPTWRAPIFSFSLSSFSRA